MFRLLIASERARRRLMPLGVVLLNLACSGTSETPADTRRQSITGGRLSGPEDDAVVMLQNGVGGICTGALIADNLVVTSLGCLAPEAAGAYECTTEGELENGGNGAGELGKFFAPEQMRIWTGPAHQLIANPAPHALGQDLFGTSSTNTCRGNIGFIVLDRRLEGVPILPLRLERAIEVGELVDVLGYGSTTPIANRWELLGTRYRRDGVRVADVDVPPKTFALGPGACPGDGGSPAFSSETGALLGVHALMIESCDVDEARSVYTALEPYRPLVLEAFQAARSQPWLEGEPPPSSGDAGASGAGSGGHGDGADGHGDGGSNSDAGVSGQDANAGAEEGDAGAGGSSHAPDSASSSCGVAFSTRRAGGWWTLVLALLALRRRGSRGGARC